MDVTVKADVPACLQIAVGSTLELSIARTHEDWVVVKARGVVPGESSGRIYGPPKFVIAALRAFLETLEFPKVKSDE